MQEPCARGSIAGFTPMRSLTFVLMGLMVLGLLAADFMVLTSSRAVEGYVREELKRSFGDSLEFDRVDAGIDGQIRLEEVTLRVAEDEKAPRFLASDAVSITVADGQVRNIRLDNADVFLTPEVGDTLKRLDSKLSTSVQSAPLPQIVCTHGRVHVGDLNPLLSSKTPYFIIESFTMHPLGNEGFALRGRVEDLNRNRWEVSGELDLLRRKIAVRMQLRDLDLSSLKKLLPDAVLAEWKPWDPQGRARVDLELTTSPGAAPTELTMVVNLEDLKLKVRDATVEHLAGQIRGALVSDEEGKDPHAHFTVDLRTAPGRSALPGGGTMRVRGQYEHLGGKQPLELTFLLEDAPIEAVRGALPPEHRKLWDEMKPEGRFTLSGTVTEAGPSQMAAEIAGARILVEPLGRIEAMRGRLELEDDTLRILLLEGRQATSTVRLEGTVAGAFSAKPEPKLQLTARALGMPIARFVELADERYGITKIVAPPEGGGFDQAGRVDLTMNLSGPASAPVVDLLVELKNNKLAYAPIPLPMEQIQGRVRVNAERTEVEYVKAVYPAPVEATSPVSSPIREAQVRVDGWSNRNRETPDSQYRVELRQVRINEAFAKKLPEPVRHIVEAMKLDGDANVLTRVWVRGRGDQTSTDFTCLLDLFGATMNPGLKLENVTGTILLDGAAFTEGSTVAGKLNFTSALIEGHRLTDLNASFTVQRSRLSFGRISAKAYGGTIEASIGVNTETGEFRGDFTGDRIDLHELSGSIKDYAERGLSGIVSVRNMTLRGKLGAPEGFRGKGICSVDEAHLWGVPVLMELFSLNLKDILEDRPKNLRGKMTFDIHDSKMVIHDLRLDEKDLEIVGRGMIAFDGRIDLIIKTNSDTFGVHIPGITDLLNAAKDQVQGWRATGTFNDPEMSLQFFPGLASPEK